MHTEEGAKKKWCPKAIIAGYGTEEDTAPTSINRYRNSDAGYPLECLCIASDCMMWGWGIGAILKVTTSKRDDRLLRTDTSDEALSNPPITSEMPIPKGTGWKPVGVPEPDEEGEPYFRQNWKRDIDPERKGYCGLAGKP